MCKNVRAWFGSVVKEACLMAFTDLHYLQCHSKPNGKKKTVLKAPFGMTHLNVCINHKIFQIHPKPYIPVDLTKIHKMAVINEAQHFITTILLIS
jgi:hypothetical protein